MKTEINLDKKELLENLARYIHEENWSGWMRYLFEKSIENQDGTVTIPSWAVSRWKRQINTSYSDLSEQEKFLDKKEVDRIIEIIHNS